MSSFYSQSYKLQPTYHTWISIRLIQLFTCPPFSNSSSLLFSYSYVYVCVYISVCMYIQPTESFQLGLDIHRFKNDHLVACCHVGVGLVEFFLPLMVPLCNHDQLPILKFHKFIDSVISKGYYLKAGILTLFLLSSFHLPFCSYS